MSGAGQPAVPAGASAARATADPFDVRFSVRASGTTAAFNAALVLSAADVHVAARLAELAGEDDPAVVLACALAVRAPRLGHVHVDLSTIRETAMVDSDEPVDLSALPWPEPGEWVERLRASPLVVAGDEDGEEVRPLQLVGSWLYLNRYWREERQVAADLLAMAAEAPIVDQRVLAEGVARLFGEQAHAPGVDQRVRAEGVGGPASQKADGRQSLAAASAVLGRLTVVAGGPGTGKTTTVARIVALLAEQAAALGAPPPLVALAAPTGKAAARLQEAVHEEAAGLSVDAAIRAQLLSLRASTLHRLLGWRPGSQSRFRHHRGQRLPHDVVIVDETSMVALSMMGRLVEAIRPGARLVLVGDPGQLASIEAGAVLGDVVGPAAASLHIGPSRRATLERATGQVLDGPDASGQTADSATGQALDPSGAAGSIGDHPAGQAPDASSAAGAIGDGIVVLDRVHRFGGGIAELAVAVRRGDAARVMALLREGLDDVRWIDADVASAGPALAPVRDGAVAAARRMIEAARADAAAEAIQALGSFRVLCAHRQGPEGVATWTAQIEGWVERDVEDAGIDDRWYVGRPLLVTENDYELRLYNGDTGVVVSAGDRAVAAFERSGEIVEYSPTRLAAVDTVYAMTIHKSQGSQFDTAAVLLPSPSSRILTRELLYTAATRARKQLVLAGTEEAIVAAAQRPIARASGLGSRLWGP